MKRDAVTYGGKPSAARMGRDGYYFEGSAVRRAEEASRPIKKEDNESVRKKRRALNAVRAREDRADILVLALSCMLVIGAAAFFLTMKHTVSEQGSEIRTLETKVLNCKNISEALADELYTQIPMEEIIRIAQEDYGMRYPEAGQIVRTGAAEPDTTADGSNENAA